jgi:uncharacterized coiled-coil protein SlyX
MPAISSFATGDLLPIVDVSEISASDKNKSVTFGELFRNVLGGSASAPSIAFTGDQNTGIYSPGADQVAVATNGVGRLFVDASGRLGVGTASPNGNTNYGSLDLNGSAGGEIFFSSGGVSRGNIFNYSSTPANLGIAATDASGQIIFNTGGYTERLRITSAGLVGIGTSAPGSVLDVASSNSGITLTNTGASNKQWRLGGSSAGSFVITETGVADRLTIDSSGRVGIGTTTVNATRKVEIVQPSGYVAGLRVLTDGSGAYNQFFSGTSNFRIGSPHNTSALVFDDGASERARIDSSGRLLVGTSTSTSATVNGLVGKTQIASSENAALALHGHSSTALYGADIVFTRSRSATIGTNTIVQNGDEFGRIYFTGANGTGFDYGASIQAVVDGTPGVGDMPGRLVFSTTADGASTPTERMRITNAGKVLIGTSTSANTVVFAVQSDVAGSAGGNYPLATIESTGTSDSGAACLHLGKKANDTSTSNVFQRFYINSSGTGSGQINANGASAAAFGSFSDERLKENIVDLPPQLQNICDLRPVEFDYKDGSGHQIGFIAQEMQEVYPDVIGETEGTLTVTGWSKTEARLVKALQEAIGRIEALEGMVAVNNITIDEQQHQLSTLAARLTALESA